MLRIKVKSFVVDGKRITNVSRKSKSEMGLGFSKGHWYEFTMDGKKYLEGAKNIKELKNKIKKSLRKKKSC